MRKKSQGEEEQEEEEGKGKEEEEELEEQLEEELTQRNHLHLTSGAQDFTETMQGDTEPSGSYFGARDVLLPRSVARCTCLSSRI